MIQEIQQPQMSDLPCEQLPSEHHFVFATTGFDFIGPFSVSQCGRHATRYVLLFTCLVVRAVHFEITENLSTDSTMNCIRRFISRRGKPKKFPSNNRKSFVSSCSELEKGIDALRASGEFASKQQWMKIENYGIGSSKRAMSKKDEKAQQILELTTNFSDGHYEIGLLWKENAKLPNNRWLAEEQLKQ